MNFFIGKVVQHVIDCTTNDTMSHLMSLNVEHRVKQCEWSQMIPARCVMYLPQTISRYNHITQSLHISNRY